MKEQTYYSVYEISSNNRKHGKLLKNYKTKKSAINCMEKSIFRYIKENKKTILEIRG